MKKLDLASQNLPAFDESKSSETDSKKDVAAGMNVDVAYEEEGSKSNKSQIQSDSLLQNLVETIGKTVLIFIDRVEFLTR